MPNFFRKAPSAAFEHGFVLTLHLTTIVHTGLYCAAACFVVFIVCVCVCVCLFVKDVSGCSAAPDEFHRFSCFVLSSWFPRVGSQRVCVFIGTVWYTTSVCVCVCVCVCPHIHCCSHMFDAFLQPDLVRAASCMPCVRWSSPAFTWFWTSEDKTHLPHQSAWAGHCLQFPPFGVCFLAVEWMNESVGQFWQSEDIAHTSPVDNYPKTAPQLVLAKWAGRRRPPTAY